MIPKIKKPQMKDLRPIALINIPYKICAGILKEKIETHDNLFILNYCIEKTYKRKKELYVISINFRKAYDSIEREKLIYI